MKEHVQKDNSPRGSSVKVCWSGGKDSTAALLLHLDRGDDVNAVCYIPYFDNFTPLISAKQLDFLMSASDRFIALGAQVTFVHGLTYVDYCHKISTRGKFKGLYFGYPCFVHCGFMRDSKVASLDAYNPSCEFTDIGIAADECSRLGNLHDDKISILVDEHLTEYDAYRLCASRGFLSPVYETRFRDGCSLCPNGKYSEVILWCNDWESHDARNKLLALDDFCRSVRPDRPFRRGGIWASDILEIPGLFL